MDFSHRRKNILTGEWVQVSPQRSKRPWQGQVEELAKSSAKDYEKDCYLCPGNERANGSSNPVYQEVYIFENDFAALQREIEREELNEADLLLAKSERGICMVVCYSPNHSETLSDMSLEAIHKVVQAWRKEYENLGALDFINHVQIFENKGEIMGCSNAHPHGQIWAQESIPQEVVKEQIQQETYYKEKNTNLLGAYIELELQKGERIVWQNANFVILVPYWAVWPFECLLVAKEDLRSFKDFSLEQELDFAAALKILNVKYDKLFACSFPYSSGIHQAPTDGVEHPEWRFHMHFYPPLLRSASVKKFMVGYEMMANPQRDFTPEFAAKLLRN
ncbi:MAG: UDP-glucose--hexose-1-phosphate uridylyltransferase [Chitinophagales bacterium]|nr:UDP-glucose--hexose-1-phosphate uridylyltransferase [Chitinophagales bacterium]